MVVAALMQLAVAAPIGALFGAAYGTSIRIGYEIIFPALFGNKATSQSVDSVLDKMTSTFTAIGGLEAQKFGINQGIKNALKSIDADPELQELIKKNSFNDTLTITVNKSGSLTSQSSEQSLSSGSDNVPDFTGGIAERHRAAREALTGTTDANEFQTLSTEYSNVFNAYESKQGQITKEQLQRLTNVNTNKNVRIWFVEWNFTWFTFSLQQKLINRQTALTAKTFTIIDNVKVKKLTMNQLLQRYGGKSKQTLTIGLNKDKQKAQQLRGSIRSKEQQHAKGWYGSSGRKFGIDALNDTKKKYAALLQRIWEISTELKRRAS